MPSRTRRHSRRSPRRRCSPRTARRRSFRATQQNYIETLETSSNEEHIKDAIRKLTKVRYAQSLEMSKRVVGLLTTKPHVVLLIKNWSTAPDGGTYCNILKQMTKNNNLIPQLITLIEQNSSTLIFNEEKASDVACKVLYMCAHCLTYEVNYFFPRNTFQTLLRYVNAETKEETYDDVQDLLTFLRSDFRENLIEALQDPTQYTPMVLSCLKSPSSGKPEDEMQIVEETEMAEAIGSLGIDSLISILQNNDNEQMFGDVEQIFRETSQRIDLIFSANQIDALRALQIQEAKNILELPRKSIGYVQQPDGTLTLASVPDPS